MATDERSATEIYKGLNVLQAMRWMASAWSKVETSTITKCFCASRISGDVTTAAADDCDDPFEELDEEVQDLIDQVAPKGGCTPSSYIESEEVLPTCYNVVDEENV